jgi:Domain of unknown function (DUF397)
MTTWRKSGYSDETGGHCVEVAPLPEAIGVRDSKAPGAGRRAPRTLSAGLRRPTRSTEERPALRLSRDRPGVLPASRTMAATDRYRR